MHHRLRTLPLSALATSPQSPHHRAAHAAARTPATAAPLPLPLPSPLPLSPPPPQDLESNYGGLLTSQLVALLQRANAAKAKIRAGGFVGELEGMLAQVQQVRSGRRRAAASCAGGSGGCGRP